MHDDLHRTPKPDSETLRRRAAEGCAPSQFTLGMMFETGHGVPRDVIEAYAWLSIAAFQDYPGRDARIAVAESLSPAGAAIAAERARRYIALYAQPPESQQQRSTEDS